MTSIDVLRRKIDRMLVHVDTTWAIIIPPGQALEMDYSLFSEQEQEQLRAFLASLEHYQEGCTTLAEMLRKVTNAELDQLSYWAEEQEARSASNG